MPYPNALLQATPRNALLGNVADFLAQSYSPERTQQAQGIANFLSLPQISRTLDRLSYGEPLTTGAGGIGGTTRFNNDALDALMAVAPMAGPAAKLTGKGALATGRFVAPKVGEMAEQYMVKQGMISPLDVYHGTPHTLPPTARNPLGEFDASKIGTGEGAQAYGHGIYTAEAKDTGRRYQMGLTQALGQEVKYKDKSLNELHNQIENRSFKLSGKAADLEGQKLQLIEHMMLDKSPEELVSYAKETGFDPSVVKWMESDVIPNTKIPGNLYKIDLPDEKIAKMLDWDKPFSQQHPDVQAVLAKFDPETYHPSGGDFDANETGQQTYNRLAGVLNVRNPGPQNASAKVSDYLMQQGIPGIKYLDEFSRGATQGTRNFVTFPGEEKNLTILERNGQRFDNSALTGNVFPQEEALRLAQQRATLPPAQGGLGLSASNTPEQRAAAMGFESGWGHGSPVSNITELRPSRTGAQGPGIYATQYMPETGLYAGGKEGATSYPLMIQRKNALEIGSKNAYEHLGVESDEALKQAVLNANKTGMVVQQPPTADWLKDLDVLEYPARSHYVSTNPDTLRSRFAAFDPFRKTAAIAAAAGLAAPDLLAGQAQPQTRKFDNSALK